MSGFFVWMNPTRLQLIGAPTWMRCCTYCLPAALVVSVWACSIARAEEVRRDTDGDGTVDRIPFVGCDRKVRRMKIDGDGRPDRRAFWKGGRLVRMEEDRSCNRKCIRHNRHDP
ncbi:MAG: hypothetical protein SWC40_06860 [Thermodesulfobacteriota bacterium]|nr:hypothetical protein [Thermodesulfobacteriota bacterium]